MKLHGVIKKLLYKAGYSIKKIRSPMQISCANAPIKRAASLDLMELLHKENPYLGFQFGSLPLDVHGWGGQSPVFRELILQFKPQTIVEVGTWKGASALEMAKVLKEEGLSAKILCIDTWLGALEFWTNHDDVERYLSLNLKHGYPSVYYQFLANVCHCGFQGNIIPFPQTSATAALWMRYHGVMAEMVYLDASHEEEDVYQDLCNYWEIINYGGVLFGDDYEWSGVSLAVNRFAKEIGRAVEMNKDKWILRK